MRPNEEFGVRGLTLEKESKREQPRLHLFLVP